MSDRDAISFFERALARNVEVKDRRRDARLYRALEDGHRRLVDEVCKRVTVSQMTTLSPGPAPLKHLSEMTTLANKNKRRINAQKEDSEKSE